MAASGSGMFIRVEVDGTAASDAAVAKQLAGVCPVDIFADESGRVRIVDENLDECILCGLCLDAAPAGAVRVIKRYDGDKLLERAPAT
ncbi:MAG: hypothetical protein ACYDEB_01690 [Dehalococcoidia bacterium]